MSGRTLLFLLLVVANGHAFSQVLTLSEEKRFDLRGAVVHLKDSSKALGFESIRNNSHFKKERSANYGFDEAAHWFKVDLANRSKTDEFLLEVAFASLDRIDFYYETKSGWQHKIAGDEFPISARDIPYQHPVFKFTIPSGESSTIYLRIESGSSIQVPAIIWVPEAFLNRAIHLQIFNGLFYGAMMLMILYQLFLFISTREKMSLYYVFTLVAMIHVVSYFQGYGFLYVYPEFPQLNHYMAIFTGPFFLIFSTWLTRAFLNLKQKHPIIDILLILNVVVNVFLTLMMLLQIGDVSFRVHHYAVLVHSVLALVGAGLGIYNKFKSALYYLLSWLTLLVAGVVFSMSNLGFFGEFINPTSSALIIACLLQMLLISFALVNRWHNIVKENELAKENELLRNEVEKQRLEVEVRLRTEEIQLQNEKLEEVNRIKDKLFSVVSHDIKGPLTSLNLALSLTKSDVLTQQEFRQLTEALEAKFNQTTDFIENLLQWARLQLRGESFEPVELDLASIVATTLPLINDDLNDKMIHLENRIADGVKIFADPMMLKSVIRNLLVNAVKFTSKSGKIELRSETIDSFTTVAVSDTGIGIPEVNRPKMFSLDIVTTPGTRQEKGTGLGLILCKEFVERNGGKIWFTSEEGIGTTFYFTVPAFVNEKVA